MPPYGGYGQDRPNSGWAIASLACGVAGVVVIGVGSVLGIVFGAIALSKFDPQRQKGRGLAIAGIIVSCVWIVLIGIVVAFGVLGYETQKSLPARSPSGQITHQGTVSIFALQRGDCFDNPSNATGARATPVYRVRVMPCGQPHNAQVFATFNVTGSDFAYPGMSKLHSESVKGCNARILKNINVAKVTKALQLRFLYPLENSWVSGNRTVNCLAVNPTATLRSSLLKG